MNDYKRFVSYIYNYEMKIKKNNVGFARVETKNNQCKITIHIQAKSISNRSVKLYGFIREQADLVAISLGEVLFKNGNGDGQLLTRMDQLGSYPVNFEQISGLILYLSDNKYFGTEWDDKPLVFNEFRLLENTDKNPDNSTEYIAEDNTEDSAGGNDGDSPERSVKDNAETSARDNAEHGIKNSTETNTEDNAGQNNRDIADYVREGLPTRDSWQKDRFQRKTVEAAQLADSVSEDQNTIQRLERTTQHLRREWQEIMQQHAQINQQSMQVPQAPPAQPEETSPPAQAADNAKEASVETTGLLSFFEPYTLTDILERFSYAVTDNFMLHGFHRFGHLGVMKKNDKFILGVPGIFCKREEMVANRSGFHNFYPKNGGNLHYGDFGYWYTSIEYLK